LSKQNTQQLVDATAYQSIVGSLRDLVNTRFDLAFVVGYVSHFLHHLAEGSLLCGGYLQLGFAVQPEEWKSCVVDSVQ
jgi:hypothetical protein